MDIGVLQKLLFDQQQALAKQQADMLAAFTEEQDKKMARIVQALERRIDQIASSNPSSTREPAPQAATGTNSAESIMHTTIPLAQLDLDTSDFPSIGLDDSNNEDFSEGDPRRVTPWTCDKNIALTGYATVEDAEKAVQQYAIRQGFAVSRKRSRPARPVGMAGERATLNVHIQCSRGGTRRENRHRSSKSDETGSPARVRNSQRVDCPYQLGIRRNKETNYFDIYFINDTHKMHERIDYKDLVALPSARRFQRTPEILHEVERMYQEGEKPRMIHKALTDRGVLIAIHDIHNILRKAKKSGQQQREDSQPGATDVELDNSNSLGSYGGPSSGTDAMNSLSHQLDRHQLQLASGQSNGAVQQQNALSMTAPQMNQYFASTQLMPQHAQSLDTQQLTGSQLGNNLQQHISVSQMGTQQLTSSQLSGQQLNSSQVIMANPFGTSTQLSSHQVPVHQMSSRSLNAAVQMANQQFAGQQINGVQHIGGPQLSTSQAEMHYSSMAHRQLPNHPPASGHLSTIQQ
ncbi:hypothetical protein HDU85_007440 [Gaertneriomyces sp. JEL0708]|nr:hypothetical protein HDU85_007440 [Gaertneriomyces sp. JEL0708]